MMIRRQHSTTLFLLQLKRLDDMANTLLTFPNQMGCVACIDSPADPRVSRRIREVLLCLEHTVLQD